MLATKHVFAKLPMFEFTMVLKFSMMAISMVMAMSMEHTMPHMTMG